MTVQEVARAVDTLGPAPSWSRVALLVVHTVLQQVACLAGQLASECRLEPSAAENQPAKLRQLLRVLWECRPPTPPAATVAKLPVVANDASLAPTPEQATEPGKDLVASLGALTINAAAGDNARVLQEPGAQNPMLPSNLQTVTEATPEMAFTQLNVEQTSSGNATAPNCVASSNAVSDNAGNLSANLEPKAASLQSGVGVLPETNLERASVCDGSAPQDTVSCSTVADLVTTAPAVPTGQNVVPESVPKAAAMTAPDLRPQQVAVRALRSDPFDDPNALCGIVFVRQRITAYILSLWLSEVASRFPNEYGFITPNFLVGRAVPPPPVGVGGARKGDVAAVCTALTPLGLQRQEEVLQKFRARECNLLVATGVVEEGIEVPRCNLVVRFDPPENLRAYVQSKGKAKAANSRFFVLVPREESSRFLEDLHDYRTIEQVGIGSACSL